MLGLDAPSSPIEISVVIPLHNEAKNVKDLVRGLASQTLTEFRVIIVDTGSVDETADMFEQEWARLSNRGPTSLTILRTTKAYPGAARNLGISVCDSEWVAFLDAGILPDAFWLQELALCAIQENVDFVWGRCQFKYSGKISESLVATSFGINRLLKAIPASMVRRKTLIEMTGFNSHLRAAEDLEFFRRADQLSPSRQALSKATVCYLESPNQYSTIFRKWAIAARDCSQAGIHLPKFVAITGIYGLMTSLIIIQKIYFALFVMASYYGFRSIYRPFLNGQNLFQRHFLRRIILNLTTVVVTDGATTVGYLWGLVNKVKGRRIDK